MKIKKNKEKSKAVDAVREFYANIEEIRDMYQNQGYLKAKSLYEEMLIRYNWQMSYMSFTVYFNKEIKHKQRQSPQSVATSPPAKEEVQRKDVPQVVDPYKIRPASELTPEERESALARIRRSQELMAPGINAHLAYREKLRKEEEEKERLENEKNNSNT